MSQLTQKKKGGGLRFFWFARLFFPFNILEGGASPGHPGNGSAPGLGA